MDSAVIPLKNHKNLSLVQTLDFFYPLVDHPKLLGKIALANVVSDLYAVGVTNIDKLSLIISAPTEFTEKERDIIIPMIIDGFKELANEANCKPTVQNIAINPWCIIGGVATSVCAQNEIIIPNNAKIGDKIILTKPLGTQLATNAFIWMAEKNDKFQKISEHLSEEHIESTFNAAIKSMIYLNKLAAELMHKYEGHAATDVTGFGLLGHASNLAQFQKENVDFIIEKLPIIKNVRKIGEIIGQHQKLLNGKAVETSGGLLICMNEENALKFCNEFIRINGNDQKAWIIGHVIKGNGNASLIDKPEIIEINL